MKNTLSIKIVTSYHNNLYDTIRVLNAKHDAAILSARPWDLPTYETERLPIHRLRAWNIRSPIHAIYSPVQLWQLIDKKTDIVIVKHLYSFPNILPCLIALIRRAKLIVYIQDIKHASKLYMRIYLCALSLLFRAIHGKILATTHAGYNTATQYFPDVSYVPVCIDPKRFRQQLYTDSSQNELRIVCVAKYQKRKNIPCLIDAIYRCKHANPKVDFSVTIIGTLLEREEFTRIRNLIQKNNLEHEFVLRTSVSQHQVKNILAQSHVAVLPAKAEPLGFTILEAMASGLPVIASQEVGASSYISIAKNGYIFDPDSPQDLADTIGQFISSDGRVMIPKLKAFGTKSLVAIYSFHAPEIWYQAFMRAVSSTKNQIPL